MLRAITNLVVQSSDWAKALQPSLPNLEVAPYKPKQPLTFLSDGPLMQFLHLPRVNSCNVMLLLAIGYQSCNSLERLERNQDKNLRLKKNLLVVINKKT